MGLHAATMGLQDLVSDEENDSSSNEPEPSNEQLLDDGCEHNFTAYTIRQTHSNRFKVMTAKCVYCDELVALDAGDDNGT